MYDKHYLTPLFEPRSVAVVGATEREGAVASIVLRNLLAAKYRGHLFAVNPHHATVHGVPSFPSIIWSPIPGPSTSCCTSRASAMRVLS